MISRKDFTYDRNGQRDYAYRRPERGVVHGRTAEFPSPPQQLPKEQPMEDQAPEPEQPAWTALLPLLIASLECGSPAMKVLAKDELERMAELADQYVGLSR